MQTVIADIRDKYGTTDPFKLAEELNIIIVYHHLGRCHGYYMAESGVKIICLNEADEEPVKRYTLAHELGHYFLHGDANYFALKDTLFQSGWQERQADKFAVNLLITNDDLRHNPCYTVDDWAKTLGISRGLVELRF